MAKKLRTVSPEERLFGLTCNLLLAPGGLSTDEVFQLPGYEHDNSDAGKAAANKLFDRDKELLRKSGIHLVVENLKLAMEDNQTFRYSIPNQSFQWPQGVTLTARQLALLEMAARSWAGASLGAATAYGMQRLRALGQEPTNLDLFGVAPRIGGVRHFDKIATAIEDGSRIEFEYRKPGEKPQLRKIEPWQLEQVASQWMVVGRAVDVGQPRRFLLKRIVSRHVSILDQKFDKPTAAELEAAATDLRNYISSQSFRLQVKPNSQAWFHFRMDEPGVAKGDVYEDNFMDLHLLAEELRQFTTGVTVLEPQALRDELEAGLRRTLEVHIG